MAKEAKQKRAALPKRCAYTPEFKKTWERYNQAGKRDMNKAREVMALIFLGDPLPAEYLDHELQGKEWDGCRECHIGGDFLLVYKATKTDVVFVDLGTHSELFG